MSASELTRAVVLALFLGTLPARAEAPWGLTWHAPEGCIQAGELAQRVEERLGHAVFGKAFARHVEGSLKTAPEGTWRAKLTLSDSTGTVLGSREVESAEPSCRSIDEPLTLVLALLVDPYAPLAPVAPPPPPPAPTPAPPPPPSPTLTPAEPVTPLLQSKGERFFEGEHELDRGLFYERVGRPDLRRELRLQEQLRTLKRATGITLGVGGVLLFVSYAAGVGCVRYGGTPASPGGCIEGSPSLRTAALAFGGAGLGLFAWSLASTSPTSPEEDGKLIEQHNARAGRLQAGLRLRAGGLELTLAGEL